MTNTQSPAPGTFRKKPVVVEAVQFTKEVATAYLLDRVPLPAGVEFASASHKNGVINNFHAYIETLEGRMEVSIGDWIITGVKGERYPCKPDIFEMTYESAALQASAAAVPDMYEVNGRGYLPDDLPLGVTKEQCAALYRHPPLPAQVQAPSIQKFNELIGDEESPVERLRFFCSIAMSGQDWLDVEPFFDAIIASRTPAPGMAGGVVPEPICSESGYLCYAYGEDSQVARLCHTREEVLQFMLREWFGDESPEKMHPDNRENWDTAVAEFDAPEWDLGDELVWELEQGGVTITKVCFYPAPHPAPAQQAARAEPDPHLQDLVQAVAFFRQVKEDKEGNAASTGALRDATQWLRDSAMAVADAAIEAGRAGS